MRKPVVLCALTVLAATAEVFGQIPNTRFINLVDTPATIAFNQFGEARIPIDPAVGNIIKINTFRKVSILVGTTHATSMSVIIGKNAGVTLAQAFTSPIDLKIHTFDVIGPEFAVVLKGGPPNTSEHVQVWVYLSSRRGADRI